MKALKSRIDFSKLLQDPDTSISQQSAQNRSLCTELFNLSCSSRDNATVTDNILYSREDIYITEVDCGKFLSGLTSAFMKRFNQPARRQGTILDAVARLFADTVVDVRALRAERGALGVHQGDKRSSVRTLSELC